MAADTSRQDELYREAAVAHDAALRRLARGFEPDADKCRDLLQEIHLALWRSFSRFDGRCSLRTWVYRVAQNVATSKVLRRRAGAPRLVDLDAIAFDAADPGGEDPDHALDRERALGQLYRLIHQLKPMDRQVMLLYLEDLDASTIGDITDLSPVNVATKVHRIKQILIAQFHKGERDGD